MLVPYIKYRCPVYGDLDALPSETLLTRLRDGRWRATISCICGDSHDQPVTVEVGVALQECGVPRVIEPRLADPTSEQADPVRRTSLPPITLRDVWVFRTALRNAPDPVAYAERPEWKDSP